MSSSRTAEVQAIANAYVERVRELAHVQKVLLESNGSDHRIYTVIQAPPLDFEEARPLYQAELEVLGDRPPLPLEFLVINAATDEVRALPPEPGPAMSSSGRRTRVLFDRQHAAARTS